MGIKGLAKFIKTYAPSAITELSISDLENKTIAFDTSILIYQFVIAIRNTGNDLTNKDGKITSHIHAIIMKTLSFLKKKINPIFVFDGKPPNIKNGTLNERQNTRKKATDQLNELNNVLNDKNNQLIVSITDTDIDTDMKPSIESLINEETKYAEIKAINEQKISLLKQTTSIGIKQMDECKQILRLMGMPVINSLEEADSQCAYLSKNKMVDAVASEDMDLLTFGVETLLRNMNTKTITQFKLSKVLQELNITYSQFIDLCILLGCDYCPTVDGIGMKKSFDLIKKYKSIEKMLNIPNFQLGSHIIDFTEEFRTKYVLARKYFLNPPVNTDIEQIKWSVPNYKDLERILINKYSYSQATVHKLLVKPLNGGYYKFIVDKTAYEVINGQYNIINTSIQNNSNDDNDDLFIDDIDGGAYINKFSDEISVNHLMELMDKDTIKNRITMDPNVIVI